MLEGKAMHASTNTCSEKLLRGDIYSQQAYLSINGQRKVYSLVGLLATISVIAALIGFGAFKGIILLQRTQFETQMASVLRPINYSEPEMIQMNEYGFDFAIRVTFDLPPELGEMIIYHEKVEQIYNESLDSKERVTTLTKLEYEFCDIQTFNHSDKEELEVKGIESYYCLKDRSWLQIGGSFNADLYQTVFVELNPCINGSEIICLPAEEISGIVSKGFIQVRFVDFYFDKDDKDQPVKSYINDQMFFGVLPEQKTNYEMKIKLSKAIYDDSLKPWAFSKEQEFPQVEEIFTTTAIRDTTQPYILVAFKLNFFSNVYQKTLYSVTDYISELGGLFNALYGGGKLMMFLFIDSYILKTIMGQLFTYTSTKKSQNQTILEKQYNLERNHSLENSSSKAVLKEALSRERLNFSRTCLDCCLLRVCRAEDQFSRKRQQLFEIGRRKMRYDLDIVALFRIMQEFSIVKKLLLTKNQRVLLKWQKQLSVQSDDEQSLMRFSNKREKLMSQISQPQNPYAKMKEIDKLKDVVESIEADEQINRIDQILLKGITSQAYDQFDKSSPSFHKHNKRKNIQSEQKSQKLALGPASKGMKKRNKKGVDVVPGFDQPSIEQREDSDLISHKHVVSQKKLANLRKK